MGIGLTGSSTIFFCIKELGFKVIMGSTPDFEALEATNYNARETSFSVVKRADIVAGPPIEHFVWAIFGPILPRLDPSLSYKETRTVWHWNPPH